MTYIILDLEWNGVYSRKLKGYFNEIIEIGAVKIDSSLNQVDEFRAVIKPVFSRKLSHIVTNLTGIDEQELKDGQPFTRAISLLKKWICDPDAVVMTWSTTDLLVLIENCRHFFKDQRIPFLNYYVDLQHYCQTRLDYGETQQLGLFKACELLGIDTGDLENHRALDDSILTGKVFAGVYEPQSFNLQVRPAGTEFYERLTFKNVIISDIKNVHVKKSDLRFRCEKCNRRLRRIGQWRFCSRAFFADFLCGGCGTKYAARVQIKLKYDGAQTTRKLVEKPQEDCEK